MIEKGFQDFQNIALKKRTQLESRISRKYLFNVEPYKPNKITYVN